MSLVGNALVGLVVWIAKRLGFALDLAVERRPDPLNEREVFEQLHYGRD